MNRNRIFLSLSQQSGFEQQYIQEALATHWITTGGPNVDAFEKDLENYLIAESENDDVNNYEEFEDQITSNWKK